MNALASSTAMEPCCGRLVSIQPASGHHAVGMRMTRLRHAPSGLQRRRNDVAAASVRAPSPQHSRNPDLQSAQNSLLLSPHAAAQSPAFTPAPSLTPPHPRPYVPTDRPSTIPSSRLNQLIKDTTSWPELATLVQQHQHHFNFIHVSAAITHLAQLQNPSSSLSLSNKILPPAARPDSSSSAPPPLPATPYAAAGTPRHVLPSSNPSSYLHLMDSLLHMVRAHMHLFGARQSANTLWALSHLHPTHPGCAPLMAKLLPLMRSLFPWCEPQHLSNSLWAAAHAGLFLEDAWVEAFLDCSEAALGRFAPQLLANTAWALASLGIAPDAAWWAVFLARLDALLPALAPVDVSQVLYSLACLGLRPQDPEQAGLIARVYGRLLQRGAKAEEVAAGGGAGAGAGAGRGMVAGAAPSAQSISNTLWALATMSVMPSKAWAVELFVEVEATLEDFKPQELSNLMWAAATLGLALPPSLVQKMYKVTRAQLDSFPAQALSNTIWALATLYPPPASSTSTSALGAQARPRPEPLLCAPPAPWASSFLEAFHASLPSMTAQNTSNTIWALATLGVTPAPALVSDLIQHLHDLDRRGGGGEGEPGVSAQALANSLWALATLGFKLGGRAGQLVVELVEGQLVGPAPAAPAGRRGRGRAAAGRPGPGFKGAELAEVVAALGKLGHALPQRTEGLLLSAVQQRLPGPGQEPGQAPRPAGFWMSGRDLSRTLPGLAALAVQPRAAWRARFWASCCALLPALGCLELSQLVYGMAKMRWNPVQSWEQRRRQAQAQALALAQSGGSSKGEAKGSRGRGRRGRRLVLAGMRPLRFASAAAQEQPGGGGLVSPASHALPAVHLARRRARVERYAAWLRHQLRNQGPAGQQGGGRWVLRVAARRAARSLARLSRLERRTQRQRAGPGTADAPLPASSSSSPEGPVPVPGLGIPYGLDLLLGRVAAALPQAPGASFAHLAWGLAQMGVQPGQEWCGGVLAELLVRRCGQMLGKDLVTSMWALGRMGFRPKPRSLELVEAALFKRLPAMKPRELAAAAWSFAAMHYTPNVEWLDAFAQQCMLVIAEFTMQDWTVVVRSLANIVEQEQDAVIYLEDLFISPQLEAQVHKFSPSALATCVHSCGVLGTRSVRLLGRLLATARPQLRLFTAQELTAVICTTARLGFMPDSGFITAWLSAFEAKIPESRGPTLAAVAWALATLGIKPRAAWQDKFGAALTQRCGQVSPKHASMLVWALCEWSSELAPGLVRQLGALVGQGLPGYDRVVRRNMGWAMMRIKSKSKSGVAREQRRAARERQAAAGGRAAGEAGGGKEGVAAAGGSGGQRKVAAAKGFR